MPFANNGSARLHWQELGEGTPLLLIMGHRFSSRLWYPALPALALRHRVIYFDNRGTGESSAGYGFSVQDLAEDARAVLDAAGVQTAHVYGVSMGGGIAMELAMRHPQRVRSLVLGCTAIKTEAKSRLPALVRAAYHLPRPLQRVLMKLLVRRQPGDAIRAYGSAAHAERAAFDLAVLQHDKLSVRGVAGQLRAVTRYATTREAVSRLTQPALVIHGTEDQAVAFSAGQQIADTLPNSELMRLEGVGHNFLVAAGPQVNARVLDFLQKVDRTGT